MNRKQLKKILSKHKQWLSNVEGGVQADLRGADLTCAKLQGADLRGANLRFANLRGADLWRADLRGADLRDAYLWRANLRDTDLRNADLDYSCLPLWCGSKGMLVDKRIAAQIAAHFCALSCDDPDFLAAREAVLPFAQTSHRADELGIKEYE